MPKIFDKVGLRKPRYSAFDLGREQKLSCKMGELVPTYLEEVVPGDQFSVNSAIMMRLAPMIAPVMHRVNVYMHFFFVPNRIIWNQWEEFITKGREGTSEPTFPTYAAISVDNNKLSDYLGIPQSTAAAPTATQNVSQLPFRAYQQIWNDYYRDPNLVAEIDVNTDNFSVLGELRNRCWEKDYFTSGLPWAQRGPSVGVGADIAYRGTSDVLKADGSDPDETNNLRYSSGGKLQNFDDTDAMRIENIEDIGIDINDLRTSSALQRWLEKNARGGYRYIEQILAHFGVESDDARLQRPEYLGGGKQPIVISEVLNTSATATEPQGDMAGHGISTGSKNSFKYYAKEHGYIMGIMSVLPRTAYQQGIHRHWLRRQATDYYFPEFANLGEQEVENVEIYFDPQDQAYNDGTFAYQQRYAEMKYGCSSVHGDFRTTLDFWHLGRIFTAQPTLSEEFMEANPDTRIFAVEDGDHLWVQLYHDVKARRPMPYFADPRLA